MKKILLLIIVIVLFPCYSFSQTGEADASHVTVHASITPEKSTVGSMLEYVIILSGPSSGTFDIHLPGDKVYFPSNKGGDKNTPSGAAASVPLYVVGNASRKETAHGESSAAEIKVEITYYRTGIYNLPELKITGPSGADLLYEVPQVEIVSLNQEGSLAEIESPLDLSGNYTRVLLLLLASIFFAALIFFLYKYIKSRIRTPEEFIPAISPIEAFLTGVDEIDAPALIAKGEIKKYVFALSILFRRYISALYGFDAVEMTTEEISGKLGYVMSGQDYKIIRGEITGIMNFWDLSKFAEFAPSEELLMNNFDSTLALARKLSPERGA